MTEQDRIDKARQFTLLRATPSEFAAAEIKRLEAENKQLRAALAVARDEALEEAAAVAGARPAWVIEVSSFTLASVRPEDRAERIAFELRSAMHEKAKTAKAGDTFCVRVVA